MKTSTTFYALLAALLVGVLPMTLMAQNEKEMYLRPSYWKPYDQRGINVFETSKQPDSIAYEGLRIRFGAGFSQQFQGLKHKNNALNNTGTGVNRLFAMTPGFNTSMANLNLDVQLADGIRLNLVTYLSTRHHNEAWVKGGYIQFDKLPFKGQFWENLMKVTTIKIGHMEINYGDAHFRRTDGGHSISNPFLENYIMDAFATEIGGEVMVQKNGLFILGGLTNGMIKGNIDSLVGSGEDGNIHKSPAIYGKMGFDKRLAAKLRFRGTVSYYHNGSSGANTLFSGDRAGSHYFLVMEKYGAAYTTAASGRVNPGFSKKVDAIQVNGFAKLGGLELFGTYENATGRTNKETKQRTMNQVAGDVIYRFGNNENLYAGVRYNTVEGSLAGIAGDIRVQRVAAAAGWFITKNVLLKAELVEQKYKNFPRSDIRSSGKFNGYVVEAVVGF